MEMITHQGRIIEVVQKEVNQNGMTKTFEFARRSPGTRLIITEGDTILLSKEFRHEVAGYDYRLPGGKVFDSLEDYNAALANGTDIQAAALTAAKKEASEEAGIEVNDIAHIHTSICGATVVWDLYYFHVSRFERTAQHLEDGEDITIEAVERAKVEKMCLDGTIGEERSALVLLRFVRGSF